MIFIEFWQLDVIYLFRVESVEPDWLADVFEDSFEVVGQPGVVGVGETALFEVGADY